MTTRDTFTITVANGDQLDDGYFNGILSPTNFALSNLLTYGIDGATVTNQKNLKSESATATSTQFMEYVSGAWTCMDTTVAYYIIIEATSTTDSSAGDITVQQMTTGKWMVSASSGTYEVNRAKVFNHLFANGSTAKIIANYTSVTAMKTSDAEDLGKQLYWNHATKGASGGDLTVYSAVHSFDNTTTNTNSSVWGSAILGDADGVTSVDFPTGTEIIASNGNTFDTDTSADDQDNPADIKLLFNNDSGVSGASTIIKTITLCKGTMTVGASTMDTNIVYDFTTTGSIPVLTTVTESDLTCILVTDSTTITTASDNVIVKSVTTLTSGNTMVTEVTFDGGTNYTTVTTETLSDILNTGTSFLIRFTITRANNTEQDTIDGYAAYHGLG